jgi:hypothetical protein
VFWPSATREKIPLAIFNSNTVEQTRREGCVQQRGIDTTGFLCLTPVFSRVTRPLNILTDVVGSYDARRSGSILKCLSGIVIAAIFVFQS